MFNRSDSISMYFGSGRDLMVLGYIGFASVVVGLLGMLVGLVYGTYWLIQHVRFV